MRVIDDIDLSSWCEDVNVFPSSGMTLLRGLPPELISGVMERLTFLDDRADQDTKDPYIRLWRQHPDGILVPRYYQDSIASAYGTVVPEAIDHGGFQHTLQWSPRPHQIQVTKVLDSWNGDINVRAPCAFGKTYLAAYYGARLGGRVLIIVPNQNKMNEWRKEMARFYGLDQRQVGTIQAGTRKWFDCPVTVAMAKTMALQDFPPEICNGFGLTVADEAHLAQAPIMSRALGKIGGPRMALTATPGRGLRKRILEMHYGDYWLKPQADSMKCRFEFVYIPVWERLRTAKWEWLRTAISHDRNYVHMAGQICKQLLDQGRRVLVVHSQISPLMDIHNSTGQTGGFIVGHESLKTIAQAFGKLKQELEARPEGSWPKKANSYLSDVKASRNPILGIGLTSTQPAGTGMDVPDLDGGVIMLPVASPDMVTQLLGRWSRVHPGKQDPLVVVMVPATGEGYQKAEAMKGHLSRAGVEVVSHERTF